MSNISFNEFKTRVHGNNGFRILTPGNPKTEKGKGKGYHTFILHLAPASLSGNNVCPMATDGCRAACLNTAGRGGIMAGYSRLTAIDVAKGVRNHIQHARINRTKLLFGDRTAFMTRLVQEISKAIRLANRGGYIPAFRLNGTSDIRWEAIRDANGKNVFEHFPTVQFYDYTKIANRKNLPTNYSLTFSLAENNETNAVFALLNGMNVAAVFRNKETVSRYVSVGYSLTSTNNYGHKHAMEFDVYSGDDTDLRFLDPGPGIIALYAKGNAKKDQSGFVRD